MNTHFHRLEAMGQKDVDLLLTHATLVNVLSGELQEGTDIAIHGEDIVGIGPGYRATHTLDCRGKFIIPGLIDAHIHLESTKLSIPQAARLMARFGTSTVITDPHEIGNVAGVEGILYQMDSAKDNGYLHVDFTILSCVPALPDPDIDTAPNTLTPDKLRLFLGRDEVVGLGEMMNVPGVLLGLPDVLRKIEDFTTHRLVVDGHAPMLSGYALNACIGAGIGSDHESTDLQEAREKLRRGMVVMIREGSSEKNLDTLLPLIDPRNASRLMFASDDLDPTDLLERGHINHLVRRAVAHGIDPIVAVQMATISPATYFGISHRVGAVCPGRFADLVVLDDLVSFDPKMVVHRGKIVFRDGALCEAGTPSDCHLHPTMHAVLPTTQALTVPAVEGQKARIMEVVAGQILTRERFVSPRIVGDVMVPDPAQDIAKVCVFERHRGTGSFGVAFVRGFGIQRGAMGSSVGHDSHNLIVVGMDDESILKCARQICEMGGGQAALYDSHVETLPLPIAGLMSPEPAEQVADAETRLEAFCAQKLGVTLQRPMAALSFMALPVIPELRITDRGLFSIAPGGYPQSVQTFSCK